MIEEFLRMHEGKTLEFKENTQGLKGILKTIVAFANTSGGVFIIGIKDKNKEIVGLSNPLLDEEKITNAISDSISPLMIADIEVTSYRNKELLVVRVPHLVGPYFLKTEGKEKGVYIRFGSTSRQADAEILHTLHLLASNKTFDELPYPKGKIDDNYLKEQFKQVNKIPTKKQCQMLGIYTDHFGKTCPSIGGLLVFNNEHTDLFPDSIIRCACFQSETKDKILDSKDVISAFPSGIEEIIAFIERHSKTEMIIGKIRRTEIPQYPPEAIRELIINAIVHTDYSLKGMHIQIALFSNRIEITNPGGLPFGQTMEKALAGYSRLRNYVIGRIFRELGFIEQWGSGLQKIHAICNKLGMPPPLFEEKDNHFRATLFFSRQSKSIFSTQEKLLVNYLKKNGKIKTQQAAKLWKLSDRSARTKLSKLTKEGVLIKVATSEKDPYAVYLLSQEKTFFTKQ